MAKFPDKSNRLVMYRLNTLFVSGIVLASCGAQSPDHTAQRVPRLQTYEQMTTQSKTVTELGSPIGGPKDRYYVRFDNDFADLHGLELFPMSTVTKLKVGGDTSTLMSDRNIAEIDFVSPASPGKVAAFMADRARAAGFRLASQSDRELSGEKCCADTSFTIDLTARDRGTSGHLNFRYPQT